MELPLGPDPRSDILRRLQDQLVQRFGHIVRAAPERRVPEWVLVQGLIGARTRSEVSNQNADTLLAHYGSWEKVAAAPLGDLAHRLATATYPNVMAERLKAALTRLIALRGAVDLSHLEQMETDRALIWLEALPGVGRKIAAGVLNASTLNRRAVVLDSHHRRVLQRMGLVPPKADTARAFAAITPAIPTEWTAETIDEHHLLMKKLGQNYCRAQAPHCADCPAQSLCKTGMERAERLNS